MADRRKILIVGGGSAGWMTAALLVKTLGDQYAIELVESSEIGTIGVGEGSVPKIASLFDALGIDEAEWMPACNATYKTGIRFKDWSIKPGYEHYFHGFFSHFDRDHVKALQFNSVLRRSRLDVHAHPDAFVYNSYLAERALAPTTPEHWPFDVQYAYHFDAGLLGEFLKTWSMERGVDWRDCRIERTEIGSDGNIAEVITSEGDGIEADIFVDCSGFGAFLIEKALGAKHIGYGEALFNDAAVAIATAPLKNPKPMTTATALRNGWAWHIPLQSRTGNGYVYSSRYIDGDAAEAELRAHIGEAADGADARHLKMRVGRLDRPWIGNCVAVGLSQGFLEPLEATGLMLSQYTVTRFIHHLVESGCSEKPRSAFNKEIGDAFDGVRDFIVAHYLTASRDDTQYWRDVRANKAGISDNLKGAFETWFKGRDLAEFLNQRRMTSYFSLNSWYYMFTGKGIYPPEVTGPPPDQLLSKVPMDSIMDVLERCTLNHDTHADRLTWLASDEARETRKSRKPSIEESRLLLFNATPHTGRTMKTPDVNSL
ncbi:tryptophan halogenase family protein [Erythrobacter sp. W53]|uniref:tryptophan halogenase family protein n=1 Tax=Erythrobacter sp. W53 TaxID=3425947 RepID=UPI003D767814